MKDEKHATDSLTKSAVSMILSLAKSKGAPASTSNRNHREQVEHALGLLLDELHFDPDDWDTIEKKMFYDIYLLQRTEEGTVTKTDLTRRGMVAGQFSDSVSYHEHCIRVAEDRKTEGSDATRFKFCSYCGQEKPANKFKVRGGAKCNACRSKEYRERKNAS